MSFRRFDTKDAAASPGFNFRFASSTSYLPILKKQKKLFVFKNRFSNKYMLNGTEYRNLYKAYGLRFIITVDGQAGRFSILPLMIKIGTGFGLMSISVILADCVMLNFTQKKKLFQKLKEVDAKEALPDGSIQVEEEEEEVGESNYALKDIPIIGKTTAV